MGNLFGRKKQSRVTEQDRAILQLKQQRDKLRQYQKRVTQQLERERALARQLLRDGRKERAKLLLKKKRYREQLLDRTENQISSLEAMVQSIEFTQIEMKVMEGLQVGNECLNKMHQVMSIEEVERILDETQEAVEYQRQIDELLAGSFTQEDEDAILEELNAITQKPLPRPDPGRQSWWPLRNLQGLIGILRGLSHRAFGCESTLRAPRRPEGLDGPVQVPMAGAAAYTGADVRAPRCAI
uniref:Charged multivesicular body protein 6 n=1 Tax=Rattus norvegicus TaxID=10116 RepID=A0A8I6AQ75_RAT